MSSFESKNALLELSYQLALDIMEYCDKLEKLQKFNMARQLWRSGTAIGAMACEAQNAESLRDFVHKLKLAAKETEETRYWIRLCTDSNGYPTQSAILENINTIAKILNSIIHTCIKKINTKPHSHS